MFQPYQESTDFKKAGAGISASTQFACLSAIDDDTVSQASSRRHLSKQGTTISSCMFPLIPVMLVSEAIYACVQFRHSLCAVGHHAEPSTYDMGECGS